MIFNTVLFVAFEPFEQQFAFSADQVESALYHAKRILFDGEMILFHKSETVISHQCNEVGRGEEEKMAWWVEVEPAAFEQVALQAGDIGEGDDEYAFLFDDG